MSNLPLPPDIASALAAANARSTLTLNLPLDPLAYSQDRYKVADFLEELALVFRLAPLLETMRDQWPPGLHRIEVGIALCGADEDRHEVVFHYAQDEAGRDQDAAAEQWLGAWAEKWDLENEATRNFFRVLFEDREMQGPETLPRAEEFLGDALAQVIAKAREQSALAQRLPPSPSGRRARM